MVDVAKRDRKVSVKDVNLVEVAGSSVVICEGLGHSREVDVGAKDFPKVSLHIEGEVAEVRGVNFTRDWA